jgi:hypothetical protein
MVLQFLVGQEV